MLRVKKYNKNHKFDIEQKSSIFLLEIMTLSPANNTDSDIQFILRGRSSIYIMNNRDTRINPCGTPCFNVPQADKILLVQLGDVTSTVCLLFLTQHLNQSSAAVALHRIVSELTKFHDSHNQKPLPNHRKFLPHALFWLTDFKIFC
jgi:hypothetical protein